MGSTCEPCCLCEGKDRDRVRTLERKGGRERQGARIGAEGAAGESVRSSRKEEIATRVPFLLGQEQARGGPRPVVDVVGRARPATATARPKEKRRDRRATSLAGLGGFPFPFPAPLSRPLVGRRVLRPSALPFYN